MTATAAARRAEEPPGGGDPVGEEMTLVEHLRELRSRLFKSVLGVAAGFAIGFAFRDQLFELLITPYCELPPRLRGGTPGFDEDSCQLYFLEPLGAFFISFKAAGVVAIIVGAPVVCYQIWRFVTPGLRPVERRYALPFIICSQLLFAGGAVFSYYTIPLGLRVLLGFAGDNVVALMDANRYLSFMLLTMTSFGITFELPLILIMLTLMGVVGSEGLRQYRRHAIFGTFIVGAVVTPQTDPVSMLLLAGPLIVFYEVCIIVARVVERRRARAAALAT